MNIQAQLLKQVQEIVNGLQVTEQNKKLDQILKRLAKLEAIILSLQPKKEEPKIAKKEPKVIEKFELKAKK